MFILLYKTDRCIFLGDLGSGSRYPFPMDVMLSRPFVHSVLSHWKVKMALSNSYSQPMNNLPNNTLEKSYSI